MIRPAGEDDVPLILDLGARLHAGIGLPGTYDRASFAEWVERLRDGLFVSPRGMIGGLVWPSLWSREYLIATEFCWWAEDGHGLALVRAFEGWAREKGAAEVQIGTQHNYRGTAVGRLLGRAGYASRETIWTRPL